MPPNEPEASDLPEFERDPAATLEAHLARRPSVQRRLWGGGIVGLVALVGIAVLVMQALPHPLDSPHHRLGSPSDMVIVDTNVSQGTVRVNGHAFPLTLDMTVPVHTGRNVLELDTVPFNPITCDFIWPVISYQGSPGVCPAQPAQDSLAIIGIVVTAADLPPAQAGAAIGAINAILANALGGTIPAGIGEAYGVGTTDAQGTPQIATFTTPTQAQLVAQVDRADLGCQATATCGGAANFIVPVVKGALIWALHFPIAVAWHFHGVDGSERVVAVTAPSSGSAQPDSDVLAETLVLRYDASGWTVTLPSSAGSGPPALVLASAVIFRVCDIALFRDFAVLQFSFTTDHVSLAGCSTEIHPGGNNTPLPIVLYRFGALLAGNAAAHKVLPALPVASPAEVTAVLGG